MANTYSKEEYLKASNYEVLNLQEDIDNVYKNMNQIENKLLNVSENFTSLKEEVKNIILDTKRESIIINAKQSIMMLQNEYDRKYKYRDIIRRRVLGLLQSADANAIRISTIETLGEDSLINNPDYWLSPALLALCSWYSNNKEMANKGVSLALKINAEMTALFFCFIHLRAKRQKTAFKWLKMYLEMQTPEEIDSKIVLILEAISSGIFPKRMQDFALNKINEWLSLLDNTDKKNNEINRWIDILNNIGSIKNENDYFYIKKNVINCDERLEYKYKLDKTTDIIKFVDDIISVNKIENNNFDEEIDKIINMLIFEHDLQEEDISNDIYKNKLIVSYNGDLDKVNEVLSKKYSFVANYNNLYSHLTNFCLNEKYEFISNNTTKLAMSLLKEIIKEAYLKIIYNNKTDKDFVIKIHDYDLITKNGDNEKELVSLLDKYIDSIYEKEFKKIKMFKLDNYLTILGYLLFIIFFHSNLIFLLILFFGIFVYNIFSIFKRYLIREKLKDKLNNEKLEYKIILLNTIVEIVDLTFDIQAKKKDSENLVNYLNLLNVDNYLGNDFIGNNRNINIGDRDE